MSLSAALPVLLQTPRRISAAFIGDSITWQWARTSAAYSKTKYPMLIPFNSSYMTDSGDNVVVAFHPGFFSGNNYVDRGVSGQNTTQMRARFQKDIVDLNPKVAVIMGGTNDLAQGVSKGFTYCNYWTELVAEDQLALHPNYCLYDKLHPGPDGYDKMEAIIKPIIDGLL